MYKQVMLRHYPHRPNHCLDLCTINVHATQVTSSPMFMKPRPSVLFMVPKGLSKSKTSTPVYQSWVESLPKTAQTDIASSPEWKHVTYGSSSLPKLQLKKFDDDP